MAIASSAVLIWLGMFLLSGVGSSPSRVARSVMRCSLGGFCSAAAFSLAYATLVPPFQSADEPNHFIGFAAFIHRPNMDIEASQWARISHFERIQFNPEEHFTSSDMGVPGIPWNDGGEPDARVRGAAVQWLWRAIPASLRTLPAPRLLLALRLVNALMFSLSVAGFFGIACGVGHCRWPDLLAIPIFLVPTLPFFAMTVSNYALLASAYVVLAAGIALDLRDDRDCAAAGPVIGAAWSLAALTSRSALPLVPFIAAWLMGRMIVGRRDYRWPAAIVYWAGGAACVAAGLALGDRDYLRAIVSVGEGRLPRLVPVILTAVIAHPWLLIVGGLAAAGVERWVSSRLDRMAVSRLRLAVLHSGHMLAAVILVMLAGSAVVQYPTVRWIMPASPPPPADYVKVVLAAGATIFRVSHPDFLTSVSFWGGFGWLETVPPPAFVSALTAASGLAFAALLWVLARARTARPLIRIGFAILGYAASMSAYALSVILLTPADLHGRYLLGMYLCMLTIGWSVVALLAEAGPVRRVGAIRAGCAAAFLTVHVFALGVILNRYF